MKEFLFVCQGNVARSQMAEALCNGIMESDISWSAGVATHTPEKYGHPVQKIVDVMNEVGLDVSEAVVKTITEEMIDASRKIVVMCGKNECPDFLLKSGKNIFWQDIEDPEKMSLEETRFVRDKIRQKILSLTESK